MKEGKTVQIRVTAPANEYASWVARGIDTAREIRAAVARAIAQPETLLEQKPPVQTDLSPGLIGWHVRFTASEITSIDAARGQVTRSRWVADVVGRTARATGAVAADLLAAQLGKK